MEKTEEHQKRELYIDDRVTRTNASSIINYAINVGRSGETSEETAAGTGESRSSVPVAAGRWASGEPGRSMALTLTASSLQGELLLGGFASGWPG